jgi:hypothetical protein
MLTYAKVIQPACTSVHLQALRADEIPRVGEIPEQIITHLRDDQYVVADITNGNPNVMYELGIRHATGKCAVLIGEHARLPFDIAHTRVITFVRTPAGYIDARVKLTAALRMAIDEGCDPTTASRVLNALLRPETAASTAVQITIADRGTGSETMTTFPSTASQSDQPGFLEILADTEMAFPKLLHTMNEFTELMREAGAMSEEHSPLIKASDSRGAVDKLLAVRRYAAAFTPLAERAEALAARYETELKTIDGGITYLLDRLEEDPELLKEAGEFPISLLSWTTVTETVGATIAGLVEQFESLGRADRQLRVPLGRYAGALRSVVKNNETMTRWAGRMKNVLRTVGWTDARIGTSVASSTP